MQKPTTAAVQLFQAVWLSTSHKYLSMYNFNLPALDPLTDLLPCLLSHTFLVEVELRLQLGPNLQLHLVMLLSDDLRRFLSHAKLVMLRLILPRHCSVLAGLPRFSFIYLSSLGGCPR